MNFPQPRIPHNSGNSQKTDELIDEYVMVSPPHKNRERSKTFSGDRRKMQQLKKSPMPAQNYQNSPRPLTPQKSAPHQTTFQPQPIRPTGIIASGRPSSLIYDANNNHFKPISPISPLHSPNPGFTVQISPSPGGGNFRPNTPNVRTNSPLTVIHEESEEKLLKELKFDLGLAQVLSNIAKLHSRELCGEGLQISQNTVDSKQGSNSSLQLSQTMKTSFTEKYVSEVLGNRSDAIIMYEKVALYYKAVEHIAASLNRARNLVSGGEIKNSSKFKEVCMDLAKLFQTTGDGLNEAKQESAELLLNNSHYRSNGSLALEDNCDLERENVETEDSSDSSSCKEEEIIRSPDKLIFVYALSLSMHAAGVEITQSALNTAGVDSSPKMRKRSDSENEKNLGSGDKIDKMSKSMQNLVNCYDKAFTLFRSLEKETSDSETVRKQQLGDYLKAIQLRLYSL